MKAWAILVSAGLSLGAVLPARAVAIQQITSPGGISAWLVEDHTNPIIAMSVSISGGAALDPPDKTGLANLVTDLLDEGAGDLDSQAYQGKLNDLSIGLDFSVGHDSMVIGLKTLAENRETAFGLLGLALAKPRFDPDAIDRVRSQELSALAQELASPRSIAARALAALLFPGHAYGRPADGDPESVKSITRDDLVMWVGHHIGRDALVVSVVGDVTPDQLKPLLDAAFAGLPQHVDPIDIPDVAPQGAGKVDVIRRPFAQSVAAIAEAGVKRADPDWYAAYVMNYVLGGGGFSSRLMTEVRVKRGLAYDTESFLVPRDHAGLIEASVATRNDRVVDSLAVVKQEWARLAENGVTEAELSSAKKYLNGSFPLELSSTEALAGLLNVIQRDHLGIDYLERRHKLIDGVTVADVRRVARRLLRVADMTTVVVGDPKGM